MKIFIKYLPNTVEMFLWQRLTVANIQTLLCVMKHCLAAATQLAAMLSSLPLASRYDYMTKFWPTGREWKAPVRLCGQRELVAAHLKQAEIWIRYRGRNKT